MASGVKGQKLMRFSSSPHLVKALEQPWKVVFNHTRW